MNRKIVVFCVLFGTFILNACGASSGASADIQTFADALIREDYHTAASYWISDKDRSPEEIESDLVIIRSSMVLQFGALKRAVIRDVDIEKQSANIIWQLERADLETHWDIAKTDQGLHISSSLHNSTQGRLNDAGVFATMTPSPLPTLSAEEVERTATMNAVETVVAVEATDRAATSIVEEAHRAATDSAIALEATTVSAQATATELAKPPEAFLTARQAFEQANVREVARAWQADAMLVRVAFHLNQNILGDATPNDPKETALDGTSRLWAYMFASKQLQKVIIYIVHDGFILKDMGNDAATYKAMFAGKGEPFDIALEQYLDSDQVATIGRENKAKADDVQRFQIYLMLNPSGNVLPNPPARWAISIGGFLGYSTMTMDGITGNIISSDFGPTGSPGAIPTSIAQSSRSSAAKIDSPTSVPAAEIAATATPADVAGATSTAILPVGVTASDMTAPSRDSQGHAVTYDASNVIDGKPETAWRIAGNGVGQSITLVFGQPVRLSEVQLIPGYAKIDATDGTNRFMQNRRVKRATLEFTNGQPVEAQFVDKPELQPIRFDPIVTSFVRITIHETTNPGTTDGRDFTAVSEVATIGQPCNASACGSVGDDIHALLAGPHYEGIWTIVEGIDGDFARLQMLSSMPDLDPAWSFVKRKGATWEVLTAGTMFPPESLQKYGIPKSLWM